MLGTISIAQNGKVVLTNVTPWHIYGATLCSCKPLQSRSCPASLVSNVYLLLPRGNISSTAAYIASAAPTYSSGIGFVISLAALFRFSEYCTDQHWEEQLIGGCLGKLYLLFLHLPASHCAQRNSEAFTLIVYWFHLSGNGADWKRLRQAFQTSQFPYTLQNSQLCWANTNAILYEYQSITQAHEHHVVKIDTVFDAVMFGAACHISDSNVKTMSSYMAHVSSS